MTSPATIGWAGWLEPLRSAEGPLMSDQQHPPPGWQPAPPPGYGRTYDGRPPGAPPGGPAYAWLPPLVHKPGVVALRPLSLGDLFDGAFKTIRRNPRAMIGMSFLVCTVFMVMPTLLTLALAATGNLSFSLSDPAGGTLDNGLASVMQNLGSVFGTFATVILNGMVVGI